MRIVIFVVFIAFANSSGAVENPTRSEVVFPQQLTAKDLLLTCAASSLTNTGRERQRYCYGFISGVEEGIRLYAKQFSTKTRGMFCVPPGTTSRQLANTYVRYASAKDVDLEKPAALVVVEALKGAFPC